MTALDDELLENCCHHGDCEESPCRCPFGHALAELALLRRCRDAVVGLAARSPTPESPPWWWENAEAGDWCVGCGAALDAEWVAGCTRTVRHPDAACPALAIDALAKEVRGE